MSKAETVCIIPARLASARLPRKVLRELLGKPLIQYVFESALRAQGIQRVLVACDDQEIKSCVERFGGEAVLTRSSHKSGTERIAEAAEALDCERVVNVQADEPLMHGTTIEAVARALEEDPASEMSTACIAKEDAEGYRNPNVVKVTKDQNGRALYFSRAPIPFDREGRSNRYFKHLGIYGYRRDFLIRIPTLPPSELEEREKLEQLKVIENGYRIRVVEAARDSIGVDTEADFKLVEQMLAAQSRGAGVSHA